MKELIFASSNAHKLDEIRAMLPEDISLLGLSDIGFHEEIVENGKDFEANAEIKANAIFETTGKPCFADDSGLEVFSLNRQPGVKSARYSGEPVDHDRNISLLLKNLEGKKDRKARFVTVICLKSSGKTFFFEGEVKGVISTERAGSNGFGYDPVFIPDGYDRTFAQMSHQEKNMISHRKMAVLKMIEFLKYL